jgi:hypothetical protein
MASNTNRKTTMAKLNRERMLRARREEKQAKKAARKLGLLDPIDPQDASEDIGVGMPEDMPVAADESPESSGGEAALDRN